MKNPVSETFYQQWKMLTEDWINGLLGKLSDEDLKTVVSPGKNHGIFILGHLVAGDDDMSIFLGKGNYLYPAYQKMFMNNAGLLPVEKYPPANEMREAWKKVCEKNEKIYKELTDSELDEPHAMVESEMDYFKTKKRILMAWQLHQAYHAGQLAIIASKVKIENPI